MKIGEILQKLRNYHIRLVIVRSPTLRLSRRFDQLMADESRGRASDFSIGELLPRNGSVSAERRPHYTLSPSRSTRQGESVRCTCGTFSA